MRRSHNPPNRPPTSPQSLPHHVSRSASQLPKSQSESLSSQGVSRVATLFIEDRRGDRQNLTYGALDRHAIPRYRPAGHGALLGLKPNYRVTSRSESRVEVEDVEVDSARKSTKQSLLAQIKTDDTAASKVHSSPDKELDLNQDFVRFEQRQPRKRRRLSADPLGEASSEYSTDSDSDHNKESSSYNAFDDFKKDPVNQRHLELTKATQERPGDVSTWLALVDFQPLLFSKKHSEGISSRNLSDLKISIYERALSHVNSDPGRHTLILGLMREGRIVWDVDKQAARWQSILKTDSSFTLWALYVSFVQSNPVHFTFDNCLRIYLHWFQLTQKETPGCLRDANCIYILLRFTVFYWECGFTERAIGTWQALIEYNCFRPLHLQPADLLASFQAFWTSEASRFGEPCATGWNSGSSPELEPSKDASYNTENMSVNEWVAAEVNLEQTAGLPARALDDVSEEDPFRVLLFSDIENFIFSPRTGEGCQLLVDAFLLFAGLPRLSTRPESRLWESDPFICSRPPLDDKLTHLGDPKDFAFDMSVYSGTGHLPSEQLAQKDSYVFPLSSQRLVHLDKAFVQRAISQLTESSQPEFFVESLMERAIALEADTDVKAARKLAKSFLKRRTDSLPLYNVYALLEVQLGNFKTAEKVWSTALSMQSSLGLNAQLDAFLLWRYWAYSYLYRGELAMARTLLSSLTTEQIDVDQLYQQHATNSTPVAALQIKTEQYIRQVIEANLSKSKSKTSAIVVDLLALYKYLNNDHQVEYALNIYGHYLSIAQIDPSTVEALHEYRARFLHTHATVLRKEFKPKEFITILSESVRLFPNNPDLVMLKQHFIRRGGIIDRLRQDDSVLSREMGVVNKTDSVFPCLLDVLLELNRPAFSGRTDHSIRSAFKRATDTGSPGHGNVGIWKAYILWETSLVSIGPEPEPTPKLQKGLKTSSKNQGSVRGSSSSSTAKTAAQTFYASLRACPWSKELCMLGFTQPALRRYLGPEALKTVYATMVDRGLRLHIDISDSLATLTRP